MNADELLVRTMARVYPLLPYMFIVSFATIAVLLALLMLCRGLWVSQKRFRVLGLFYDMNMRESVTLACAWIKLLLLLSYLIGFRQLRVEHYLLFLLSGLLCVVLTRRILRMPLRLLWFALECGALLSCNMICSYIQTVYAGKWYLIAYIIMSIVTALFGVYLFLAEADAISGGRRPNLERGWEKAVEEER